MIDFIKISTRTGKRGVTEIYPKFIIKKSSDLMIRGGDFYAIWIEELGFWSTDEQDVVHLIDHELDEYADSYRASHTDTPVRVLYMWDAESGTIDSWHKYCQRQMRDNFHTLDDNLIFSNTETKKTNYASKKLNYPLEKGECPAYEKMISTLYSEQERQKIEWAIGAVITGESKRIQKFLVLYGAAGTGKSTILNIIQQLFDGYYSTFNAKSLGSSSDSFALEAFKDNPMVAIQHDGDLSRIEDNTRLNSLVSHEMMTINEKFKSTYSSSFRSFLFMGTNKPVKITDAKSGLIRRLIDVTPTGNKLSSREYKKLYKQISFELGAIAYHCREVYLNDPNRYDDYVPIAMIGATNDFYNFVLDSYSVFKKEDSTTLKSAWAMYTTYCEEAKVPYPLSQRLFKEELKNYFRDYKERFNLGDGARTRSCYLGFKAEKFEDHVAEEEPTTDESEHPWLEMNVDISKLDAELSDCLAQYASKKETPLKKWDDVKTTLSSLDTKKLHYVKPPINHIVIDFDIPDENGNKSFEKNLEAASKWPPTYAETSKSGQGIHLHYIYTGDATKLSRIYEEHVEIKVFSGNGSLRRKLTKCNDIPISTISSGLPLKGEKMVSKKSIKTDKELRSLIIKALNKDIWPNTKPSIDFIDHILNEAYDNGVKYDVSDLKSDILYFASESTNQSEQCVRIVSKMKFKSEDESEPVVNEDAKLIFFDVEIFKNLFLVNWKLEGDNPVVRMINPTPSEIEDLLNYNLVGFNCRRYDNHMLYARLMGYSNEQLYELSQKIITEKNRHCFFGEAYNLSYTDVLDFSSKKQSLKKFEIELGISHQELGLPWDQPVPKERWLQVAEYCDNDVIATEAVFNARKADFVARNILADVANMTVNDTTNSLTTRIIFGNNRKPQSSFNYRNMGDLSVPHQKWVMTKDGTLYTGDENDDYTVFDEKGRPLFPGYVYEKGVSTYRGEEVGEGGYVYAELGIHKNVALLDIVSMHPSSIAAENLFGEYTKRFEDVLNARISIKHKDFENAKKMLNGALAKYLTDEESADSLAQALKIAINSVYGLTSANFENPFRDIRNKDNIVAKRGALFMINLKHKVQERGFTVAHIKTDSIKIPDATPEIIQFVMDYGKMYGYTFEHEATYEKMCLVNDAVYIAKYAKVEDCYELYGKDYVESSPDVVKKCKKHPGEWEATGTQFAVPYVFKTLFSHEPLIFSDYCETKSVTSALYLDMNEDLPDVSEEEKRLKKAESEYKKGNITDEELNDISKELSPIIEEGHCYRFVGRVGLFCPIKAGSGGGLLLREQNGKYHAAVGSKGFRWMESEMVKTLNKEEDIDKQYYINLADEAIETISQYGDFEWFSS